MRDFGDARDMHPSPAVQGVSLRCGSAERRNGLLHVARAPQGLGRQVLAPRKSLTEGAELNPDPDEDDGEEGGFFACQIFMHESPPANGSAAEGSESFIVSVIVDGTGRSSQGDQFSVFFPPKIIVKKPLPKIETGQTLNIEVIIRANPFNEDKEAKPITDEVR